MPPIDVISIGNMIGHLLNDHFRNLNWRYLPYIRPIYSHRFTFTNFGFFSNLTNIFRLTMKTHKDPSLSTAS